MIRVMPANQTTAVSHELARRAEAALRADDVDSQELLALARELDRRPSPYDLAEPIRRKELACLACGTPRRIRRRCNSEDS